VIDKKGEISHRTHHVTGALEKIKKQRLLYTGIKVVTIGSIIIGALYLIVLPTVIIGMLFFSVIIEKPEVYEDITKYNEYMSFSREKTYDEEYYKWSKLGMDETIWPSQITDSMNVADYKMVYYNPWDAQFLGYMVVDYSADEYAEEVKRLKEYKSTEYIGYYCVKEEKTHELLAVNADSYYGFVYALTDGKGRIIYGEQLFCNYFMDLDYSKYIPKEYLLDGFDATTKSDYYKKCVGDK